MAMLIPAVVPYFFATVPIKAFQAMVRGGQGKGEATRFSYKEIDSAKIVFHKRNSQYDANLQRATGKGKYDYGIAPSSSKYMPPKTKSVTGTPLEQLTATLYRKPVLLKKPPKVQGASGDAASASLIFPSADARNADHIAACTDFIKERKLERHDASVKNRDLLAGIMKKKGGELENTVQRCDTEFEEKYPLEFAAFFVQHRGKDAAVAFDLEKTLRDAHNYAGAKALRYALLSDNADMQNYAKFLCKMECIGTAPAIPARTGAVAYQPQAPAPGSITLFQQLRSHG
jgi:hypothetical protein